MQPRQADPPFHEIALDDWDALEDTPSGRWAVARGLIDASNALRQRAPDIQLVVQAIAQLHQIAFAPFVPELAGHFRGPAPNYLPTNVSFGQHRGTPYEEVPAGMERLAVAVENLIAQLDELQATVELDELIPDVLKAGAWAHCELVRIHPFPNGNGRVSRLAINYFCYRYGLLPIAIERPRGDYLDAIRAWL